MICHVLIAIMGKVQVLSKQTLKLIFDGSPINLQH